MTAMTMPTQPDPAIWEQPDMRAALRGHDIGSVYRLILDRTALSSRQIAYLTTQSQSEVSEILHSRRVLAYDVLERIAEGLGVPRGYLGLAYSDAVRSLVQPASEAESTEEDGDEEMKRRNLLHLGSAAVAGIWTGNSLAEIELPGGVSWEPTPLSPHLGTAEVEGLRAVSEALQTLARKHGGNSELLVAEARRQEAWLGSDPTGPAAIRAEYLVALAELWLGAGWAAHDEGLRDLAYRCLIRAMGLAREAGDPVTACRGAYYLGVALSEASDPSDGLQWLQGAEGRLIAAAWNDPRTPALQGWIRVDVANLYAAMGREDMARRGLVLAQDAWAQALQGPPEHRPSLDDEADFAWVAALVERKLGKSEAAMSRLDVAAEQHWRRTEDRRQLALWKVTGAELHLQARDRAGLSLAEQAIKTVQTLGSSRARQMLAALTRTLHAHGEPGRELARLAANIA